MVIITTMDPSHMFFPALSDLQLEANPRSHYFKTSNPDQNYPDFVIPLFAIPGKIAYVDFVLVFQTLPR